MVSASTSAAMPPPWTSVPWLKAARSTGVPAQNDCQTADRKVSFDTDWRAAMTNGGG